MTVKPPTPQGDHNYCCNITTTKIWSLQCCRLLFLNDHQQQTVNTTTTTTQPLRSPKGWRWEPLLATRTTFFNLKTALNWQCLKIFKILFSQELNPSVSVPLKNSRVGWFCTFVGFTKLGTLLSNIYCIFFKFTAKKSAIFAKCTHSSCRPSFHD